jgi:hypothetical protein
VELFEQLRLGHSAGEICLPLFRRRLRNASLRQPRQRSEEDFARQSARGNRTCHRLPVALGFPEADDLESLNRQLLEACVASWNRTIIGREMPVAEAAPAAAGEGKLRDTRNAQPADRGRQGSCEKTNWYSAPLWPGLRVTAHVWPSFISIEHDGKCVARHPKRRNGQVDLAPGRSHARRPARRSCYPRYWALRHCGLPIQEYCHETATFW